MTHTIALPRKHFVRTHGVSADIKASRKEKMPLIHGLKTKIKREECVILHIKGNVMTSVYDNLG